MTNVTLITGDGIGPEIAEATRRCIDATGAAINWEIAEAGVDVMEKLGTPLPEATIESVGISQHKCLSPAAARPFRLPATLQELQGRSQQICRYRPGSCSREYRRPLRGNRVREGRRRHCRADRLAQCPQQAQDRRQYGYQHQAHIRGRDRQDRSLCL